MSSSVKFADNIHFKPGVSRTFLVALVLLYVCAVISLSAVLLDSHIMVLIACLLLLASLGYDLYRYGLTKWSIPQPCFGQQASGSWYVDFAGERKAVEVLPSSYVSSWLVVLRFRDELDRKIITILLTPGSLTGDEYRHLLARLKCG